LNGSWLKRKLSRRAFRIEATEPIIEIAPSHYIVKLDDTQRCADFRTHPKYAKRLYYSLIAYWWFLHFLDWAFLDRFVPQYSFGLTALVVSPDVGAGGGPCDGYIARYVTAGNSFSNIRTGAGTSVSNTTTAGTMARLGCHGTNTDEFLTIRRAGFSFDTSAVGAGSTVSTVRFNAYAANAYSFNTYDAFDTISYMLYLVEFNPVYPATIETTDYNSFGTDVWGGVGYDGWVGVDGYNEFHLIDVANLNKSGTTSLGVLLDSDFNNTALTWKAGADFAVGVRWADYTGTASDPYLTVNYTPAVTTVYKPSAIVVG
jgi:hypothetical protein